MSELINNREYRQQVLKELIKELHNGKNPDEVKAKFTATFQGVSTLEIAELEKTLIAEGMPVEEVQRLCDVHASVFQGSIAEIHRPVRELEASGHPVHTFRLENRAIAKLLRERIAPHLEAFQTPGHPEAEGRGSLLAEDLNLLRQIDKHYARKENLVFPYLEKYGVTAPPKVMWGVDDEIRAALKEAQRLLEEKTTPKDQISRKLGELTTKIEEMIRKEEDIMLPMAVETLAESEWAEVAAASGEIGYCLIEPPTEWRPVNLNIARKFQAGSRVHEATSDGVIRFETGMLTAEQIGRIFDTLPVDLTFVDRDGAVQYFSQGKDRIFPRPKTIIGRKVQNCHPPASVHIVEQIVTDLQSGRKDHEDFWLKMGPKYVYIRYFAVRDAAGEYLGTMEITQDIQPIQEISGEKRLLSDLTPVG